MPQYSVPQSRRKVPSPDVRGRPGEQCCSRCERWLGPSHYASTGRQKFISCEACRVKEKQRKDARRATFEHPERNARECSACNVIKDLSHFKELRRISGRGNRKKIRDMRTCAACRAADAAAQGAKGAVVVELAVPGDKVDPFPRAPLGLYLQGLSSTARCLTMPWPKAAVYFSRNPGVLMKKRQEGADPLRGYGGY
jgi:hypothetical protein